MGKCIDCGDETIKAERCSKCYAKEYYKRPEVKAKQKKYYQKPEVKTERRKYKREYQRRREVKIKAKKYRQRPESKSNIKKYQRRPGVKVKMKERRKTTKYKNKSKEYKKRPHVNISNRLRERMRIALKEYTNNGKIKKSDEYGINYKDIIARLKPFPRDRHLYDIDHIIPLASFNFINKDGTQNLKEIKKAFAPENHQWLLAGENRAKGKKIEKQSKLKD